MKIRKAEIKNRKAKCPIGGNTMSKNQSTSNAPSNKVSVTFRVDKGVLEHNNRTFIAKNVVRERVPDNIIYKQEDIRAKYHEIFDKALDEYNTGKRADRKITDYYEHMLKSKKEKPFYEVVVQFGDIENCGFGQRNFEQAKQMLDEYMKEFEKRNPNMKVFNAVMHLDEATPHLHIDFLPVCHNQKQGLSTRISMKKALEEQGFISSSKRISEWAVWATAEKEIMTSILKHHGLSRDVKNAHYAHMECEEYRQSRKELEKLNKHINELKQKPDAEITQEEVKMIKNQNDFMRSEIVKRDEKIRILSKKAGARFVPFEVYSPDKMQFITDELQRSNIQFVEESNTLYIPDWATKNCCAIAAKYQFPSKSTGIHDEIKLDIDTLVYSCENFPQLLDKLREKGYEIKEGKYLAVKSPNAQRFVRLKTLGEDYLPQNIEKRIADRDKFPKQVQARSAKANETEQRFYSTITQTVIAVRTFMFRPQKTNPKKIYSFENDKEINHLSQQLLTMRDFNLNSRDDIYEAAERSQKKIDDTLAQIRKLTEDMPTLKSDIAQLKFYFSARQNNSDAMNQVRLAAAKEVANKYGITSAEEIENLETRLRLSPTYISSLKNEVSEEQMKLSRISDLVHTYEKIIKGNYIDNLVAAERERRQREEKQEEKKQDRTPDKKQAI